jgi:hypothetical protein
MKRTVCVVNAEISLCYHIFVTLQILFKVQNVNKNVNRSARVVLTINNVPRYPL